MLLLSLYSLSLTGCATTSDGGLALGVSVVEAQRAGSQAGQAAQSSRQKAQAQLAPACGTPTAWTQAQRNSVADSLEAHAAEPGIQLIGPEWARLNKAVKTCRGES